MKLAIILAALVLAGCATGPTQEVMDYHSFIAQQKPRAEAGEIKWSTYYKGLFAKASAASAPGYLLSALNQSSGVALRYEAGQISKDQFDYEIRAIKAESASANDAAMAQVRIETDRRAQLGVSQMAAGIAMMQASQPQPAPIINYQQPIPIPGNAYVTGYLRDQSQSGTLKYCNYSNGAVITIAAHQICPQSTK
jgi:hypothetical protein